MIYKTIALGLGLVFASLDLVAADYIVPLKHGKPSQQEFERAAKRAFFSRNYSIWSVHPDVVIGKYKNRVEVAIVLGEKRVVLTVTDSGGASSEVINKYLRNLKRDFTYEIADYALAGTGHTDPAKVESLAALAEPQPATESASSGTSALVFGTYQSEITSSGNWGWKAAYRDLVVNFKQDGDKITGYNELIDMKIEGTVNGDEVQFTTWPNQMTSEVYKGTWKISEDGRVLTGKWWYSHAGGDWNLTKVE